MDFRASGAPACSPLSCIHSTHGHLPLSRAGNSHTPPSCLWGTLKALLLLRCQFDFQREYDPVSDLVLQGKDVCEWAVVAFGPQMLAGGGIDQLGRDPHLVVRFADAAFQYIPHSHLAADVLHFGRFAFVSERRVACDNKETGNLREVGRNVLGDAVAEILLLLVVTHVDEG